MRKRNCFCTGILVLAMMLAGIHMPLYAQEPDAGWMDDSGTDRTETEVNLFGQEADSSSLASDAAGESIWEDSAEVPLTEEEPFENTLMAEPEMPDTMLEEQVPEEAAAEGEALEDNTDAGEASGPSDQLREELREDELTDGSSPDKTGESLGLPIPELTGCYNSVNGADLYWTKVDGAIGYYIYRNRAAEGGNVVIDIVDGDTTHYYDLSVRDNCWGRVYVYTIRAIDEEGNQGEPSNAMTLQRLAPMTFTNYYAESPTKAVLTWDCVQGSNKAYGYELQYALSKADLFARTGSFRRVSYSGRNNLRAEITGLSRNTSYYFRVRGYVNYTHSGTGVTTKTWSQYSSVVTVRTPESDSTKYRALMIGNTEYYKVKDWLLGPGNDAGAMTATLKQYGYSTALKRNLTGYQMLSAIRNAYTGADSNDVSLFFYSGHGETSNGSLLGVDYSYITMRTLASMLAEVPGKVVVVLDSCGSGGAISKGASSEEEDDPLTESFNPEDFNRLVVEAFAEADPGLSGESELLYDPEAPQVGYGELRSSKFLVLTASAKNEASKDVSRNGVWGGALTRTLVQGAGCGFPNGNYTGEIPADTNHDKKLTLSELYNYLVKWVPTLSRQHVGCYPSGSTSVVMVKR